MNDSVRCILALLLALGTVVIRGDSDNDLCAVTPKDRTECGFAGISKKECLSRGCCFNSSISGVKWCFSRKEKDADNACNCLDIGLEERVSCGFPGIDFELCKAMGCCYDSRFSNSPSCYVNAVKEAKITQVKIQSLSKTTGTNNSQLSTSKVNGRREIGLGQKVGSEHHVG